MSVQPLSIETAQKIQHYIRRVLTLPDSENHPKSWATYNSAEDLPEPGSLSELGELFNFGGVLQEATYLPNDIGHWFISSTNPGSVLLKLPGLRLKPDWRLTSFLNRTGADGIGATWAIPVAHSTTAQLEATLAACNDRLQVPRPANALEDVMAAIEGDRTSLSFLTASLLRRELQELGALGKSCNWSHHRLVATAPAQVAWDWRVPPKELTPKVRLFGDGRAAIEFFTCRTVPPVALFQHIDQYAAESYTAVRLDRPIAVPKRP